MKKKLEADLISIAHRILKLKGKEDVIKMHDEVKVLFEKLSVLKFAHEHFEDDIPTIGSDSSFFEMLDGSFNNKISDSIEVEDKIYINLDEVEEDDIIKPGIETIKNMVAQMPNKIEEVEVEIDDVLPKKQFRKNDFEEITAGFKDMPVFEPVAKAHQASLEKTSLNDKLKKGAYNIGLNDKIAFIKHLFDGQNDDYERVLSQLSTLNSFEEASQLIETLIKPDYHDWIGKEEFEERFLGIIKSKFE